MASPLGLARDEVRVVDYDPDWPRLYEIAALDLTRSLGSRVMAIEHYGSTAVAGLASKPIIDILAAMGTLDLSADTLAALDTLGYEFHPLDPVIERRFFAKGPPTKRTHNLSICLARSRFWQDRIAFRDALRTDALLADDYSALKQGLAQQFAKDRGGYTNAKEAFIKATLDR